MLASGSIPTELKSMPFDGKNIVDNWGALDFDSVPKKLAVVGAGVIGLELGSVWRRLGAEVVVLEALDTFLAVADQGLAKEAARHFKKQGLDIKLGAKVSGAKSTAQPASKSPTPTRRAVRRINVDKLIVCVGRRPFTRTCWPTAPGVQIDERGFIKVDDHCKTTAENVWAVGDCVRGPMLAHKAKDEGVMVGDMIAGRYGHMNYNTIPSVIYTHPEIAWVGQTEEQVKASGRAYKIGQFPFAASGRARAMESTAGFVKLIAAQDDDEILGVHIIGPAGRRAHRRGRAGDGVFGEQRRPAAHDPRASDAVRSAARSGAGRRQTRHRQHQQVDAAANPRPTSRSAGGALQRREHMLLEQARGFFVHAALVVTGARHDHHHRLQRHAHHGIAAIARHRPAVDRAAG